MKLTALITTFVLGTSSLALADASAFHGRPGVDDRHHDPADARRAARWIPLAQPIAAGGTDTIRLGERVDDLAAVRLHAAQGATYVYWLLVHFDDGTHARIDVRKWVYAGAPRAQLALPKHRGGVGQIDVVSWAGNRNAKLQLLGRRERTAQRPLPLPPPISQPPHQPVGVLLGANLSFANTNGYRYVSVGAERGRFKTLRLEGVAGRTPIAKVRVDFANGRSQTFANLGRVLARGQVLDITLDAAQPIANVLVVMDEELRPVGAGSGTVQLIAF